MFILGGRALLALGKSGLLDRKPLGVGRGSESTFSLVEGQAAATELSSAALQTLVMCKPNGQQGMAVRTIYIV